MAQHFSLSTAARTLSMRELYRMTDDEAHSKFKQIRWSETNGEPVCPHCGQTKVYAFSDRRTWKCSGCRRKFSVTSGTLFHARKLKFQDYLIAVAVFVNAVKGNAALQLAREIAERGVSYKTAFVLVHKFREAMGSAVHAEPKLSGVVEVDGAYFGAPPRPENVAKDRIDRRLAGAQTGNRQVVAVARERWGRTLPYVVPRESAAVPIFCQHIEAGTILHGDEGRAWDRLHAFFRMFRVNHSIEMVAENGASVNWCESYNARIRRAEYGQHHRINGHYLQQYANEIAWREDHRFEPNGLLWRRVVGTALNLPRSRVWCGYWQRGAGDLTAIPGMQR
jgi:transposase-like protein